MYVYVCGLDNQGVLNAEVEDLDVWPKYSQYYAGTWGVGWAG